LVYNSCGDVGVGFRSGPLTLPFHVALKGVLEIAAGHNAAFALLNDGTVRAWGANGAGQLGDGTRNESLNPVRVIGLSHVVQIAASGNHVLALLENGTVFAWGADFWGNLGNGTRDSVEGVAHPIPQQVPGLHGVVAVAAGGGDDLTILANGTVLAWGEDKNGQLGDGSTQTKLVPTPVIVLAGVRSVAMGGIPSLGAHMLALLSDGQVMVAGQNIHGQLGLGDTVDRHTPVPLPGLANVASVSASGTHSLAVLSNGTVLSWGEDRDGELGYPAPQICGPAPCATSPHPVAVADASVVSAGDRFSVAVSGGRVLAWGNNEYAQLGDGSTAQSTVPVEVAGITGIAKIAASERFTLGLAVQGPAPDFFLTSGPGALTAEWAPAPGPEPWAVSWRVASHPPLAWGKPVVLPVTTHSYVITGLSKTLYEVRLTRLNSNFGRRIAFGTPG
jgi:alpha-tubulin suppressor-like RCC1 family protein